MGQLYNIVTAIQKAIDQSNLDPVKTRGTIGLKAGTLLSLVKPDSPDDADKIQKLKAAAKEVLGVAV